MNTGVKSNRNIFPHCICHEKYTWNNYVSHTGDYLNWFIVKNEIILASLSPSPLLSLSNRCFLMLPACSYIQTQ